MAGKAGGPSDIDAEWKQARKDHKRDVTQIRRRNMLSGSLFISLPLALIPNIISALVNDAVWSGFMTSFCLSWAILQAGLAWWMWE